MWLRVEDYQDYKGYKGYKGKWVTMKRDKRVKGSKG
jgi:hypothetical protein